ncbi:hypothetical protein GN956_G17264 [Arapaima gigas]
MPKIANLDLEMFCLLGEKSDPICLKDPVCVPDVIGTRMDAMVVLALRILLIKITIFNVLITAEVVVKCRNVNGEQALAEDLDVVLVHSVICTVCYSAGMRPSCVVAVPPHTCWTTNSLSPVCMKKREPARPRNPPPLVTSGRGWIPKPSPGQEENPSNRVLGT